MLRLLKNLSETDISQPGSRLLRRPGSSLFRLINSFTEMINRWDVIKRTVNLTLLIGFKKILSDTPCSTSC